MEAKEQIFSPRDGNAIMAGGEDGVIGLFTLTQDDNYLDREETEYLLGIAGVRELPKEAKKGLYRGKDIFSMLLPKGLNFETQVGKDTFKIKNGELVEGVVTKKIFGNANKLFIAIAMKFGFDELEHFVTRASKIAFAHATMYGVTMGVQDYIVSDEIRKEKAKLLAETQGKVDELITQYKTKKLEPLLGLTLRQSLEQMLVVELDLARSKASQILIKNVDKHNNAMLMANSGARASILNFEQMSLFLGQQATWEGRRIKRGYYSGRVLPHMEPRSPGREGIHKQLLRRRPFACGDAHARGRSERIRDPEGTPDAEERIPPEEARQRVAGLLHSV